ncbi:hypothetical protein ABCY62_05040 [Acetivibrio clariflavus]|uniref:hypothetical protein n=1 Tax=Acetivibrio clariflavus TaxID=288965 RepID=UPI0031F50968
MGRLVKSKAIKKIFFVILAIIGIANLFTDKVKAYSPENEEEIRKKLSKILNSGEFSEKTEAKSLLEVLHDKFIEFLKNIWEKLNMTDKLQKVFSGSKVSKEVLVLLQIIAIAIILAIIVLVIYFVVKRFTYSRKVRQEEDALLLNVLKDADEVYRKAFDYYNTGDYTQGLRFLYISLLIRLNDLNIIRINKAKTNKQYLVEIKDNKPEIHGVMAEFTHVFNRYWYGGKKADKSIFVKWNDEYGSLFNSCK